MKRLWTSKLFDWLFASSRNLGEIFLLVWYANGVWEENDLTWRIRDFNFNIFSLPEKCSSVVHYAIVIVFEGISCILQALLIKIGFELCRKSNIISNTMVFHFTTSSFSKCLLYNTNNYMNSKRVKGFKVQKWNLARR